MIAQTHPHSTVLGVSMWHKETVHKKHIMQHILEIKLMQKQKNNNRKEYSQNAHIFTYQSNRK
jgi:hypothetical protein